MKTCSKCGILKEKTNFWVRNNRKSGVNSECKDCCKKRRTDTYKENAEDFRVKRKEYYKKNKEKLCKGQIESQKGNKRYRKYQNRYLIEKRKAGDKKFTARAILGMALKAKMINKPSLCSVCGKEGKIEGHHHDYDKPLEVIWVCNPCHRMIHKEIKDKSC